MNIKKEHAAMVHKLFKSGAAIADNLPYEQIGHIHAVMGIVGETGELYDAVRMDDYENTIEELGDLLFYTVPLIDSLGIKLTDERVSRDEADPVQVAIEAMRQATILVDLVKKGVIYNQDYKLDDIADCLSVITSATAMLADNLGYTIDTVLKENMDKLIGPNGRYPDAEYSDKAAKERADKKDGE